MATKTTSKKTSSRKSTATKSKTKSSGSASSQNIVEPVLKRAKSASWLAILESIVIGVFGAILVLNPDGILKVLFYVIGIFLIVKGVYHIVNYFAVHGKYRSEEHTSELQSPS